MIITIKLEELKKIIKVLKKHKELEKIVIKLELEIIKSKIY